MLRGQPGAPRVLPDGAQEFALPPRYSIPLPVTLKDIKDGQPVERIFKDIDELWQADHGRGRDTNLGVNAIRATAALAAAFPRHFVPEQGGKHHAQPSKAGSSSGHGAQVGGATETGTSAAGAAATVGRALPQLANMAYRYKVRACFCPPSPLCLQHATCLPPLLALPQNPGKMVANTVMEGNVEWFKSWTCAHQRPEGGRWVACQLPIANAGFPLCAVVLAGSVPPTPAPPLPHAHARTHAQCRCNACMYAYAKEGDKGTLHVAFDGACLHAFGSKAGRLTGTLKETLLANAAMAVSSSGGDRCA